MSHRPRLRALIVEASQRDFLSLQTALQRGGYRLESVRVETAAELGDALPAGDWDVVLADYSLPGFEAPEALDIVRRFDPDLPFILVTGKLGEEIAARTMQAGAQDCIYKSNLARLLPVLERELRQAQLRRESRLTAAAVQRVESALRQSEERFLRLAANIPECFWLIDVAERRVVYVNAAYPEVWGGSVDALYADRRDWLRHVHPDDFERMAEAAQRFRFGGVDEELRVLRPDGSVRWLHVRTFPILDERGEVRSVGGVASDVTGFIEQQQRLTHLAHYDSLTALPNRLLYYERLSGAIALARRKGRMLAVLFIDLDRFKNINDTLGHLAGDELLRQVSGRLSGCLRESDTLGRLGGDEFAVILPELETSQRATVVARKMVEALLPPIHLEGQDVFATASIGITLFPDDAEDLHALMRNADTAMYRAKDVGRNNYQFYTAAMNERAREHLVLETELHLALARDEFVLHYQPKVSCSTGQVLGVEALLRWQHPRRGLVSPAEFIPLLEETGMIVPVGHWVLRTACAQAQAWHGAGLGRPTVAVNLSARQLQSDTLLSDVAQALEDSGLAPAALELELTESVLMHNTEAAIGVLSRLKAKGVLLSVDDFGTGYSSLSYLKRFPLDTVKVDRSFVRDIAADPDDASITRAVITMAHHLKLEVVAEGVETEGQLALLIANHCDQIQGFYFSRPLPPDELAALLREGRCLPAGTLLPIEQPRGALFLGGAGAALRAQLENDGYRVFDAGDAAGAASTLAANPLAAVVACAGAEGMACLAEAAHRQPEAERILLVGDEDWPALGAALNSGLVQRCFRAPIDDLILRRTLMDVFQRRELLEDGRRLSHETQSAGSELLRAHETARALMAENADLRLRGEASFGLLQEMLPYVRSPLIGVDDEGMIALANDAADALFAAATPLIGTPLAEALPATLLAAMQSVSTSARIELPAGRYRLDVRPLGVASASRGTLLILHPELDDL